MKENILAIVALHPEKFILKENSSDQSPEFIKTVSGTRWMSLDILSQDDVDEILKEVGVEYELYNGGKLWHWGVWRREAPFSRPASEAIYNTKREALEAAVEQARKMV